MNDSTRQAVFGESGSRSVRRAAQRLEVPVFDSCLGEGGGQRRLAEVRVPAASREIAARRPATGPRPLASSFRNSSSDRVEWPAVQMTGSSC